MTTRRHTLISPSRVGQANRARVLEALHMWGPQSRAELARVLGVNRATITTILQPLFDAGALVERAPTGGIRTAGKPPRPVWFADSGPMLGSVHVRPGRIEAAKVTIDGTIVEQAHGTFRAATASGATIRRVLLATARKVLSDATLFGIGVATAGMVDTVDNRIIRVHLAPGLDGFDVTEALADFGVPVFADHHPRVQALGDRWFGAGRGLDNFASVYTGEALGFGIVQNGSVVRGPRGAGGESGHTTVQMGGIKCHCGKRGCWETIATTGWLTDRARSLGLIEQGTMTAQTLISLAQQGNRAASRLADTYAKHLAVGMANQESVFACSTYIVHGDAGSGGEDLRVALERWLRELSPDRPGQDPTVVLAERRDVATLLGGAGLVLSNVLNTGA